MPQIATWPKIPIQPNLSSLYCVLLRVAYSIHVPISIPQTKVYHESKNIIKELATLQDLTFSIDRKNINWDT